MVRVDAYAEIWERFKRERRLEFGGHTDPEWRDGHAVSASFVMPVEAPSLREGLKPLRDALRPFPFVSLHPDHFMHLTLLPLGFLVPKPEADNELSRERLEELEVQARETLRVFLAFEVDLANLNVFPGAAFVEARDGEMLEKLRDAVCGGCELEKTPGPLHLTLAYLQEADGALAPDEFVASVERHRDWPVGSSPLSTLISPCSPWVPSPYPELETFARIPLAG